MPPTSTSKIRNDPEEPHINVQDRVSQHHQLYEIEDQISCESGERASDQRQIAMIVLILIYCQTVIILLPDANEHEQLRARLSRPTA